MMKQALSVLLLLSLTLAFSSSAGAQTYTLQELQQIARTKNKVAKLYSEGRTRVVVQLEGGEVVKGYLDGMKVDTFTLELYDNKGSLEIPYFQVKQINKRISAGKTAAMIGLTAAAGVGVLYGTAFLLSKCGPCME
jgi:hypothetical protein